MKLPSPIALRRSRIEIVPLIDIMFFLLASFMMVGLQMEPLRNIAVNLPPAVASQPDFQPDMIHIAVDRAGAVWFAKRQVTLAELAAMLGERGRANRETPVYISGDRDTLHASMAGVLRTVRAAGFQEVAFAVQDGAESGRP